MTTATRVSDGETAYARKTRARILAAAERRFKHFGYAKTTMVDIASDCAMSHANVYRFFSNKSELLDAIAAGWLVKSEEVCREVAARPLPARERLVAFIISLHRWKKREYERASNAHTLLSMAIYEGRPFIDVHLGVLNDILTGIVADGNARGEFTVRDAREAAIIIQNATLKFCHPLLVEQCADEPLEEQAHDVMRVLLDGLSAA